MGPADLFEQELLDFTFSLATCSDQWIGAVRVQQRDAALAEAVHLTLRNQSLVKFLPARLLDYLTICFPDADRPRSPNSCFDTTRIGVVRLASAPASHPVFATVQEPFAGTRLAFGGPRSLQTAPKGRGRKARLAARGQRARAPEPDLSARILASIPAPVPVPAALVPDPDVAPAATVPSPVPPRVPSRVPSFSPSSGPSFSPLSSSPLESPLKFPSLVPPLVPSGVPSPVPSFSPSSGPSSSPSSSPLSSSPLESPLKVPSLVPPLVPSSPSSSLLWSPLSSSLL
ncbi:hypothetical protein CgunFtcFv8_025077 [Champsocephalus gunnari]|uniref:Uncharacterized protein n=1 Tax=Champsocephalus gunnari TaxID=52237 RepID=A0AAN8HMH9_CHAGU|nr:hypothetical protein CgunFtcFv8_025077 [Champsocephalus gunnari]